MKMPFDTELCLRIARFQQNDKAAKFFSENLRAAFPNGVVAMGDMIEKAKGDVEAMPEDFLDLLEEAEEMAGVTQAEIDKIKAIASGE